MGEKPKKIQIWIIGLLVLSFFQMGLIRRKDDAILKTQTDPITYEKKSKELKDGPKGPAMPSMTFYGEEDFLNKEPISDEEAEALFGERKPEDLKLEEDIWAEEEELEEDSVWWMDQDFSPDKTQDTRLLVEQEST